jgi:hypothetical protein
MKLSITKTAIEKIITLKIWRFSTKKNMTGNPQQTDGVIPINLFGLLIAVVNKFSIIKFFA